MNIGRAGNGWDGMGVVGMLLIILLILVYLFALVMDVQVVSYPMGQGRAHRAPVFAAPGSPLTPRLEKMPMMPKPV